jgi:hypothetical protein
VEARLAAIRDKNSTFDHSADLDIVYEDDEVATAAEEGLCTAFAVLGPVLAGAVGSACRTCAGAASGSGVETAAAAGTAPAAAPCQQAAAMVLNLDDLIQSTPEVLEIELDTLDFDQLTMLKQVLDT